MQGMSIEKGQIIRYRGQKMYPTHPNKSIAATKRHYSLLCLHAMANFEKFCLNILSIIFATIIISKFCFDLKNTKTR